jgi:uncharacterized alkaline shock family protein YloU
VWVESSTGWYPDPSRRPATKRKGPGLPGPGARSNHASERSAAGATADRQHTDQSPLRRDLGTTTIQKPVLTAIIGMAAQEVEGVAMSHGGTRLPGDTSRTVGEFVDNLTGSGGRTRGLSVEVGERQATVGLTVNIDYGRSLPQLTAAVRRWVIERVESLTGLEVSEENIKVNDVSLPEG